MMGGGGRGASNGVVAVQSSHHRSVRHMLDTYGQHGGDKLSLWLTNAKEAAAKITEATKARQKVKEEKYSKLLRDLHSRVSDETFMDKSSKSLPAARHNCLRHAKVDSDFIMKNPKHEESNARDGRGDSASKDPFRPAPRMDKVRVYLEKQLNKNTKGRYGISKLHRECMIQALLRKKPVKLLEVKPCAILNPREQCKSAASTGSDCSVLKPFTEPFALLQMPTTTTAQDVVTSEPCTPTGWNMIPTSFTALQLRNLESASSLTESEMRESDEGCSKSPRLLSAGEDFERQHRQIHILHLPRRSVSSVSRFCRDGVKEMRGKENVRSSTSLGNFTVHDHVQGKTKEPLIEVLSCQNKEMSECKHPASSSSPSTSSEAVTASLTGVALKGREEYEKRGQSKQFFSDIWKCTMEAERKTAHEQAHSRLVLKEKRIEQKKLEKRQQADLVREKFIAKNREAVQTQLKNVAALKARRDAIVQRHRAVEKKRFWNEGWHKKTSAILDYAEDCETEESDIDLTSVQELLRSGTSKAWLKLQALHKQLYLNLLAEKKWMKH